MQKKSYGRMDRINEEVRRALSEIIRDEVKDPRLDGALLSVLKAEVSKDLKYGKIYISVLGGRDARGEAGIVLKNASGFIRRALARQLNLRNTPELTFVMDDSIEYSIHIEELLAQNPSSEPSDPEAEE